MNWVIDRLHSMGYLDWYLTSSSRSCAIPHSTWPDIPINGFFRQQRRHIRSSITPRLEERRKPYTQHGETFNYHVLFTARCLSTGRRRDMPRRLRQTCPGNIDGVLLNLEYRLWQCQFLHLSIRWSMSRFLRGWICICCGTRVRLLVFKLCAWNYNFFERLRYPMPRLSGRYVWWR